MVCMIIIFGLSIAVLFFLIKHIALNKQIKSLTNQIHDSHHNFVMVDFINRNLEELTIAINEIIEGKENAKIEADKNYKLLQQSIANISHDIRTPLTSVIGYLQIAMKDCSDEQQILNMKVALERARYCNQLIDDFYELSIAEARDKLPQLERLDISALLCEQILGNYVDFESHGLKPNFAESDKSVWVIADKVMLIRVLQNLISNMLKYAVENADFHIEENDNHMTRLTVSNPVMQDDIDAEKIFQKFYQKDLSRGNSGSGIGLYLCRCFVERMGGNISAECKGGILKIIVLLKTAKNCNDAKKDVQKK